MIPPSSLFGMVRKKSGAEWVLHGTVCCEKQRTSDPEDDGVAKEERIFSSQHAENDRITRDYAQTYGMGASRAADEESCSPVDPSRMPRVPDWPERRTHKRTDARLREL